MSLVIISTHPIQYHAPVYRCLQQRYGMDITVIYGSDYSIAGYLDKGFASSVAWDTNLLSGYRSIFLKKVRGRFFDPEKISCRGLEAAMDNLRPTAVLILGYAVKLYQRAWVHARKRNYPVAFRMETYDGEKQVGTLKRFIRNFYLRFIYKQTEAFLYIGKASLQHYRDLGVPENKLFFSPYTVDTASFQIDELTRMTLRAEKRQLLKINRDDTVILFSGKFIPKKDPSVILKALRTLPREFQKKIVVLYLGDGPLKSLIENEAGSTPLVRVHFCGFQNQTQLSPFYHASDFLVLPSLFNETWGLVVNEALAHGLPCVVSDQVGCGTDLVEPGVTGEVFKKGEVNDLADGILKISRYCHSADTKKSCLRKVSSYSIEAAAQGITRAYKSMIMKNSKQIPGVL